MLGIPRKVYNLEATTDLKYYKKLHQITLDQAKLFVESDIANIGWINCSFFPLIHRQLLGYNPLVPVHLG